MKRLALSSLGLSALISFALALSGTAVSAGKPGGQDARRGTITALEQRPDRPPLANVALEGSFGAQEGVTVYGAESMQVRPGMRVRLDVVLGTAVFSLPVGTVLEVSPDGSRCVVSVDESLLDATMEDPTSRVTVKLRDYFLVGAGVSISR